MGISCNRWLKHKTYFYVGYYKNKCSGWSVAPVQLLQVKSSWCRSSACWHHSHWFWEVCSFLRIILYFVPHAVLSHTFSLTLLKYGGDSLGLSRCCQWITFTKTSYWDDNSFCTGQDYISTWYFRPLCLKN